MPKWSLEARLRVAARRGNPYAAALLRNGIIEFSRTATSSTPVGEPEGAREQTPTPSSVSEPALNQP